MKRLLDIDDNTGMSECAALDQRITIQKNRLDALIGQDIPSLAARTTLNEQDIQTIFTQLGQKAAANHTHDWAAIQNKPTIPTISQRAHIDDVNTNTPTGITTNAPTDAKTDYGVLAAILGADANAINTKQNAIGTACNNNGTKLQALITIVKDMAQKFNLSLDAFEANGMLSPT